MGHGNLLFVSSGRNNFVLEDLNVLDFMVGVDASVELISMQSALVWNSPPLLLPPSE